MSAAPSIFLCFCCKHILNKLSYTHEQCGYSFCIRCYKVLKDKEDPPCCEEKGEFHPIKEALITSIQTFKQMCPSPQCMETVTLQGLETHLSKNCKYSGECEYCHELMNRSMLPFHIKDYCKQRTVTCKWCLTEGKVKDIDEHEQLWWLCIGGVANLREHPVVRTKTLTKRKAIEISDEAEEEEEESNEDEAVVVVNGFERDGFVVSDDAVDKQTPKQIERDYNKWRQSKKNH